MNVDLEINGARVCISGDHLVVTVIESMNEPAVAADTAGDYLREPVTAASGQIVREGDAPRESNRQASAATPGDGDASCPDTISKPLPFIGKPIILRPHCLAPELCASGTRDHCWRCKKAMAESEAA